MKMPGHALTLYAIWQEKSGQSSGGVDSLPSQTVDITINGTVVSAGSSFDEGTGTLTVSIGEDDILASASADSQGNAKIGIEIPEQEGADAYIAEFPTALLTAESPLEYEITTPVCTVTVPGDMLSGLDGYEAGSVGIRVAEADTSGLDADLLAQVGDRPVVELSLVVDGSALAWNNPDTPVWVSIPYIPMEEELQNPNGIVVWYIDGSGNLISVPDGYYDPETSTVTFSTTHFSKYAVGYRAASFIAKYGVILLIIILIVFALTAYFVYRGMRRRRGYRKR